LLTPYTRDHAGLRPDLLKEAPQERLTANGGKETPFVQGLRAQIARYEKPRAENPVETFSVGMRGCP
jgi:hypothetical protein